MDTWSDERDGQLREWRTAGNSYELISRMFTKAGFPRSKGSVIGRALRLGLIGMIPKQKRNLYKQRQPIQSGAALFERMKAARPAPAVLPTPTGAGEFLGLHILELDLDQCRYPEGDGDNIRFCGQPQAPGSPYCAAHHRICNIKTRAPV